MLKWEFVHTKNIGQGIRRGSINKNAREVRQHQIQVSFTYFACNESSLQDLASGFLLDFYFFHSSFSLCLPVFLSLSPPPILPSSFLSFFPPLLFFLPSLPLLSFLPSFHHFSSFSFLCHIFLISVCFLFFFFFVHLSFSYSPFFTHNLCIIFLPKKQTLLHLLASNSVVLFHTDPFQPQLIAFI